MPKTRKSNNDSYKFLFSPYYVSFKNASGSEADVRSTDYQAFVHLGSQNPEERAKWVPRAIEGKRYSEHLKDCKKQKKEILFGDDIVKNGIWIGMPEELMMKSDLDVPTRQELLLDYLCEMVGKIKESVERMERHLIPANGDAVQNSDSESSDSDSSDSEVGVFPPSPQMG